MTASQVHNDTVIFTREYNNLELKRYHRVIGREHSRYTLDYLVPLFIFLVRGNGHTHEFTWWWWCERKRGDRLDGWFLHVSTNTHWWLYTENNSRFPGRGNWGGRVVLMSTTVRTAILGRQLALFSTLEGGSTSGLGGCRRCLLGGGRPLGGRCRFHHKVTNNCLCWWSRYHRWQRSDGSLG